MSVAVSRRLFAKGVLGSLLAPISSLTLPKADRPGPSGASPRMPARRADWVLSGQLLEDFPRLMELTAVPGVQMTVIEDGNIAWTGAFGVADADAGTPVTTDTLFEGASFTKPMFAYGALTLVARRLLDLDRPLMSYLPALGITGPQAWRITPRHVLTHTTGLVHWRAEEGPLRADGIPGRAFSYSGEAFFCLQRVIEALLDRPVEQFMQEAVFRPFGMQSTTLVWTPDIASRLSRGHFGFESPAVTENYGVLGARLSPVAEQWGKPVAAWRYEDQVRAAALATPDWPAVPNNMMPNAAASVLTNSTDFARFMLRMLEPGTRQPDSSDALGRSMLRPATILNSALAWGIGWGLERDGDEWRFWHAGDNEVFRSFAIGDQLARRGLVIHTNSSNGHKLYQHLVPLLTKGFHASLLWHGT